MDAAKGGGGLGRIAARDPAAFNVAWAACGQEDLVGGTRTLHLAAVTCFALQEGANEQVIQGARLGDWLTLYDPFEFAVWYRTNRKEIDCRTQGRLDKALRALGVL